MLQFLRVTLAGGLLFLVPFVVLAIIVNKALALAHKIVAPLAAHIPLESVAGIRMERLLAIATILLFCFIAGCLARTALAKRAVKWLETTVLSNIPAYEFLKSIGEGMLGVQPEAKWEVVFANMDGVWRIGFLVERLDNGLLTVFLPDAPNPHSGEVHFMKSDQVMPVNVAQPAALKCLKRLGAGSNTLFGTLKFPALESVAGQVMKPNVAK